MTRRRVFALAVFAALILLAGAPAQADSPGLTIGFNFVAAGKMLNAGTYAVSTAPNGSVVLTPAGGGAALELTPIKPLKRNKVETLELVFDQAGSMWFLAEAWVPETGGYQIYKVENSLDRKTVKAPKAK